MFQWMKSLLVHVFTKTLEKDSVSNLWRRNQEREIRSFDELSGWSVLCPTKCPSVDPPLICFSTPVHLILGSSSKKHGLFVLEPGGCRGGGRFRGVQLCSGRKWDAMWIRWLELVLADEPGRLSVHGCESRWLSGQRGNHERWERHAAGGPSHHPLSCPRAPRGPHNPLLRNGRQISRGTPARSLHLPLGH